MDAGPARLDEDLDLRPLHGERLSRQDSAAEGLADRRVGDANSSKVPLASSSHWIIRQQRGLRGRSLQSQEAVGPQ